MIEIENKRVYISGKIGEMTISDATRERFARVARFLASKGATVIDPASEYIQDSARLHFEVSHHIQSYESMLLYMLHWLRTCTHVYVMSGWQLSPGAVVEHDFACAIGRHVLYERREDAVGALMDVWTEREDLHDKVDWNSFVNENLDKLWLPVNDQ